MQQDLRAFWHRFQTGIEVAVASAQPDNLLGARDGFLRYFHSGRGHATPVAIVAQGREESPGLSLSDDETLDLARERAESIRDELGDTYHFYVSSEGGLHEVAAEDRTHFFVRCWTYIISPAGEACGASGSIQIPQRLAGDIGGVDLPFAVPGTRRGGGLTQSLTGGLETRRTAVALSTFHALSSLFYGMIERRPGRSGVNR